MPTVAGTGIEILHSAGAELTPDSTSYVVPGADYTVLVDPGPSWHVSRHLCELRRMISPSVHLILLVQSPLPGSLSGLALLEGLGRRRTAVMSWRSASLVQELSGGIGIRSVGLRGAGVPLGAGQRLLVRPPLAHDPPGSLVSFHTAARMLFSGPYFGSVGSGKDTSLPILRRESIRAFSDLFTPQVDADRVAQTFGSAAAITCIGPAHGRPVVGGRELIAKLFAVQAASADAAWAFHRLYIRLAALIGEEAAAATYRASGAPIPDIKHGYHGERPPDATDPSMWANLFDLMQRWLPAEVIDTLAGLALRLAPPAGLPVPEALRHRVVESDPRQGVPVAASRLSVDLRTSVLLDPGIPDFDALNDRVTGLLNESVFRQRLGGVFAPGEDGECPGAALFIGLDHMERLNATHGRTGGDEALYAVAYLLRSYQSAHSRGGAHRLYKLNGPTFAYVLAAESLTDAADHAEAIRRVVAESSIFLEQLTVSIGVVGFQEALERAGSGAGSGRWPYGGESPLDTLVHAGIGRLQVARRSGANTVCAANPEEAAVLATGATVLIADPDAPYLDLLTRRLEEHGFSVLVASDGAEAIETIEQIAPDLIVSEMMLPKVNGLGVREHLRHSARLSQIPFVLVSHRRSQELVEKASMLGVVHFLRKPVSMIELVGLVRNLTSRRSDL